MQNNNVNGDVIDIMLRQLGVKEILKFSSTMHIANFDLGNGFIVSYVFNITKGDKYFLQRMKPYAMVQGKYASYKEIIDFITGDIEKFRKAKEINDVEIFLKLADEMEHVKERVEHVFLHHDVSSESFKDLLNDFHSLLKRVELTNRKSDLIQ